MPKIDLNAICKKHFPNNPAYADYMSRILKVFLDSGLADSNSSIELSKDEKAPFLSKCWEASLYNKFMSMGWEVTGSATGPDFLVTDTAGKQVYVEATVPEPFGIPDEYLDIKNEAAKWVPVNEIVLRITAALRNKSQGAKRYLEKEIIEKRTPYIVAVNLEALSPYNWETGYSQFPIVVEAVYPVGPPKVVIDKKTSEIVETTQPPEWSIKKANGSDVAKDSFLGDDCRHISALLGAHGFASKCNDKEFRSPRLTLVHNFKALHPISNHWAGVEEAYGAKACGSDEVELTPL